MLPLLYALLATARSSLKPRRELALENLALRQQLAILQRKTKRRPEDPMVLWARRIAERRNTQIAITALARKMAGVLYAMWRDGQPYRPQLAAPTTT